MFSRLVLLALAAAAASVDAIYYDSYNQTVLTDNQRAIRDAAGNTFWCVNSFAECNSSEWRRIDGSCNSLSNPTAGAGHAPFSRLVDAQFNGSDPRLAANGSALPNPRWVRTRMLAEGRVHGSNFTQLMLLFFVFAATDIAAMSIHDSLNYVSSHPNCCTSSPDAQCYPISVPWDDPVHRFSGVRCLNMTRPISFQSSGCIDSSVTPPHRMNYGTPFFDLSNMYGNDNGTSTRQRLWTGGLLNYTTTSSGKHWPQYIAPTVNRRDGIQGLTGVNFLFGLWFWREHNRVATKLASLNSCWDDEKLFMTARDIVMGEYAYITYYELFATLMGADNLAADNVLAADASATTFRDLYDDSLEPEQYLESLLALRWIHTMQEGNLRLYNSSGSYLGEFPEVNFTLSTNSLNNANLQYYTQGSFRSPTGAIDNIVDPVAELGLGPTQRVVDLTTSDLMKNRLFGVAPYVDYLNFCWDNSTTFDTFDSMKEYMPKERRELLAEMYGNVTDVDLMAGLWAENLISDGYVPKTFYCLITTQLQRMIKTDRHWFERDTRPNAYTEDQLATIRNASAARLLCDNGDSVTEIQPYAFLQISDSNPLTSCDEITQVDLSLWTDDTCSS